MNPQQRVEMVTGIKPTGKDLQAMTKGRAGHTGLNRRRAARIPAPDGFPLVVRIDQPGGGCVTVIACVRDMSALGIAFYHSAFLHSGTECSFLMKALDGTSVSLPGRIARCRHVQGRLHVVGAEFESPLDLARFIKDSERLLADAAHAAEPVAPDQMHARVVSLAGEIKGLADARAEAGAIFTKIEELAGLVTPVVEARTAEKQGVPPAAPAPSGARADPPCPPATAPGDARAR